MNPTQIKILYELRNIHLANEKDTTSSYHDPIKGGTNSDNFYFIDGDYKKIEQEAVGLEQAGYIVFTNRDTVSKGLKITPQGIAWLQSDELIKKQQADTQAQIDAEKAEDDRVTADFNRMRNLGLL